MNKENEITKSYENMQEGGKDAAGGRSSKKSVKATAKKEGGTQAKNKPCGEAASKKKEAFRDELGRFTKGNSFSEKYEEKYADELLEFFKQPITKVEYRREFDKNGNLIAETPVEIMGDFPTMGMFAIKIGVSVTTLKSWAGISDGGQFMKPRFAKAYQMAKEWAGGMIESGALSGKLNANMAKFVLTNDYGKRDSQDINVHSPDMDEKDLALIKRVEARLAAMDRAEDGDGVEEG